MDWICLGASAAALFLIAPVFAAPAQPGKPALACEAAAIAAPKDATISSVKAIASPVPYCRVDGTVTTRDPGPNQVGFAVSLPEHWNGRYAYTLPGGAAGFMAEPSREELAQGYAVATTDKGSHASAALDFSFRSDPARDLDWKYRGSHVAALATQAITRAYYARPVFHRYIQGCSGGGMATLTEAELYPEDGDGYIPAAMGDTDYPFFLLGRLAQFMSQDPSRWISPAELQKIGETIMREYDASDGAVDGLIWDPTKIRLKRDLFPFLNDGQFATLELLSKGVPPSAGAPEIRADGFWLSNPAPLWMVLGKVPPPWTPDSEPALFHLMQTSMKGLHGASHDVLKEIDFSDPKRLAEQRDRLSFSAWKYNPKLLAKLQSQGGKIVMWNGAADSMAPPLGLVHYEKKVAMDFGAAASAFYRAYLVPGMYHCRGGEGQPTDVPQRMLAAAVTWIEDGKAPDFVVASNRTDAEDSSQAKPEAPTSGGMPQPSRTYLLCAYPRRAVFKGGVENPNKLDVNDAKNWRCSGVPG